MSVYLFTKLFYLLLLFLLMCGTLLCGQVCVYGETPKVIASETDFGLFEKDEQIKVADQAEGITGADNVKVKDYYSPFLVANDDFFVALAGVNRDSEPEKNIDIVAKYIEKNELLREVNGVASITDEWKKQFAVYNEKLQNANKIVKGLLAVASGNEIYILHVNYTKTVDHSDDSDTLGVKLVVGTVENEGALKKIKCSKHDLTATEVTNEFKKVLQKQQLDNLFFNGSAFLTDDGKAVFALVAGNLQKTVSAVVQLNNNKKEIELGSVYKEIPENCRSYFFPWNKKVIMIFVGCSADGKQIMESSDMGKNWSVCTESLSRHYKFLQNKYDFATVKNGSKEILLFTEHRETTTDDPKKKDVYLWMSDGNRFKNIAKIAADVDTATPIGFSFADNKLFFLNQQLTTNKKCYVKAL